MSLTVPTRFLEIRTPGRRVKMMAKKDLLCHYAHVCVIVIALFFVYSDGKSQRSEIRQSLEPNILVLPLSKSSTRNPPSPLSPRLISSKVPLERKLKLTNNKKITISQVINENVERPLLTWIFLKLSTRDPSSRIWNLFSPSLIYTVRDEIKPTICLMIL